MNTKPLVSLGIIAIALGLTYAPLPGLKQTITVVAGTELQAPLSELEPRFEAAYPNIQLELEFQGSQELLNRYLDDNHDFDPTVLIPANGELLVEHMNRWQAANEDPPFYDNPQPIAKTMLVAIAWRDRGQALFPNNQFRWEQLETAITLGNWEAIGGSADWGSFDFLMTDPERSNSGQLTLALWSQSKIQNNNLTATALNQPEVEELYSLIQKSVYQPPRSTDTLLQEFISRGPNDADIATVYESIALYRWQQSVANQGTPYQIYYLDPTIETVSTAAIARRDVSPGTADAAREFLNFLTAPEQQAVFIQFGFRPAHEDIDLATVPNSPWSQNIPGAELAPPGQTFPTPDNQTLEEIKKLWHRAQ